MSAFDINFNFILFRYSHISIINNRLYCNDNALHFDINWYKSLLEENSIYIFLIYKKKMNANNVGVCGYKNI